VKSLTERINLRLAQNHSYRIAFVYPQNINAGSYYLVAVVDNGSAPALKNLDPQDELSASTNTVDIAPPFISLAGSALSAASRFTDGKTAQVLFTLTNNGNVPAIGTTTVEPDSVQDQTVADGTTLDPARASVSLAAGKGRHIA